MGGTRLQQNLGVRPRHDIWDILPFPVIPWRLGLLCLAALAEWAPRRPADVLGVVTGLGPGSYGWEAMVEARGDARHRAGEPTRVYFGSRPPPRLRVGCRVRVWFQDGMVMLSYPGQAWAEALHVDSCPAVATRSSRPAA
jgi:hypothetical protein